MQLKNIWHALRMRLRLLLWKPYMIFTTMDVVLKNKIMLIFLVLTSWQMKKNTILNKYLLDLSDRPLRRCMIWRLISKNVRKIEPKRWVKGWTSLGFTLQWNHHVTLHKKLSYDHSEIIHTTTPKHHLPRVSTCTTISFYLSLSSTFHWIH